MKPTPTPTTGPTNFERRVSELREELRSLDPTSLARRAGAEYQNLPQGGGRFSLDLWGKPAQVSFPEFVARDAQAGSELSIASQALLLYYFRTADGTSPAGRWISFSEVPGGRFYNQAYQGYTGAELARVFRSDPAAFEGAAGRLGGVRQMAGESQPRLGDAAFAFQALPRLALLVVYWLGDEDFPPSFQVLFDASAGHYLPADVCAILGGMLTRKLIGAARLN